MADTNTAEPVQRQTVILRDGGELWNADPKCKHKIIQPRGGGIKCSKCGGWFCY